MPILQCCLSLIPLLDSVSRQSKRTRAICTRKISGVGPSWSSALTAIQSERAPLLNLAHSQISVSKKSYEKVNKKHLIYVLTLLFNCSLVWNPSVCKALINFAFRGYLDQRVLNMTVLNCLVLSALTHFQNYFDNLVFYFI